MANLHPILFYFMIKASATVSGLFYLMTVENLGKMDNKFVLALILILFLAPFGAWVVSAILKIRQ
jgi:hypothetical protein